MGAGKRVSGPDSCRIVLRGAGAGAPVERPGNSLPRPFRRTREYWRDLSGENGSMSPHNGLAGRGNPAVTERQETEEACGSIVSCWTMRKGKPAAVPRTPRAGDEEMSDITQWLSLAERALVRLRRDRTVISVTLVHDGGAPKIAVAVPFTTDPTALDFNPNRVKAVEKQVRSIMPRSIPFQIVTARLYQEQGMR